VDIFSEEVKIDGAGDLPITLDVTFNPNGRNLPVVIFCHGFKGFKDWGPWNLVAKTMAEAGFFFVKLNFSHNGVTANDLSDISDPEAFGKNNFSLELNDLGLLIDWIVTDNEEYRHYFNTENISLVGHSLGAAITLLRTIEDDRIHRAVTWAGAFNLTKYTEMEEDSIWREKGFVEVTNSRTGAIYPVGYQFKQDYLDNADRLNLQKNIPLLDQPLLLIHGSDDEVAPISNSKKIHTVVKHSLFLELEGDHAFGASHPQTSEILPEDLEDVVNETIEFIGLD